MAEMSRRLPVNRMDTLLGPSSFASELWVRAAAPRNHRFDKHGNPLPMELYGCGCGLCARKQRALLKFWETR